MATSTISMDKEVYSTSEAKVGTWIDGKPLYRKVFTGSSYGSPISTGLNTARVCRTEGYLVQGGYFVAPYYTNASDWWNYYLNANDCAIYIRGDVSIMSRISKYIVIIEYVKE